MIELLAKIPGEHAIEHATGIYIGLLLVACLVGIACKWIAHLPYTIALTVVGLLIALLPWAPRVESTGFSKELIFFVMLPPLLFQGSLHMNLSRLLAHFWPIVTFAVVGVLLSTFVIGGVFWLVGGIGSVMVAMLFGAMITPTDPVSVLALFRECKVPDDLKYLVEGESLFNDGTGVVIFTIILGLIVEGGEFAAGNALLSFVLVVTGGLLVGLVFGGATFFLLNRLEDHLLENALCLVLAYGAFWVAEVVHVSGVIATVVAGLLIGNYGKRLSMHEKTIKTIDSFFESVDFLINSLLFILIGLELQHVVRESLSDKIVPILAAILGLIVARALCVYPLYWVLNLGGTQRPKRWAHVLFWGGLRGSIPIALLLGLPTVNEHGAPIALLVEYRPVLLVAGFATVFFSLVVQGLTMKPLLNLLNLGIGADEPKPAAA
ncbi:MAG: sodium:proton antiporter [Phycisphaerales bacterium]|nr:sodium:proton antiporter [Phycisphaerales bacterium]